MTGTETKSSIWNNSNFGLEELILEKNMTRIQKQIHLWRLLIKGHPENVVANTSVKKENRSCQMNKPQHHKWLSNQPKVYLPFYLSWHKILDKGFRKALKTFVYHLNRTNLYNSFFSIARDEVTDVKTGIRKHQAIISD